MITKPFVEKILYDEGNMEILPEKEESTMRFYSVDNSEVTGAFIWISDNRGILKFEPKSFFKLLKASLPSDVVSSNVGCFVINELQALRRIIYNARNVILEYPNKKAAIEDALYGPALNETEVEAVVKERKGQLIYRSRLEKYWHNKCAVTGVDVSEVLRASHAKAWKDCETGAERLSPFNGLLLCANLDALFDKHLISFDKDGRMLISNKISAAQRNLLGIEKSIQIHLDTRHQPFMAWHRKIFTKCQST